MSETPVTPKLSTLVASLLAVLVAAIGTHRTDTDAIAQQKADSQAKIDALNAKITELEGEASDETDLEGLRGQINDALTQAQAAKPPTEEHVAEVDAIAPAAPPADQLGSGEQQSQG